MKKRYMNAIIPKMQSPERDLSRGDASGFASGPPPPPPPPPRYIR